jgi:lipopolysaccharide/colanic/teichoic acid biosynthesis glycosyltransferase
MTLLAHAAAVWRRLSGRGRPSPLKTADLTRAALAVARSAADRTGQCLSVVVFRPRTADAAAATWALLSDVLADRLRMTDEAGWLDDERVCAILPFTPPAGAAKLAEDVCGLFPPGLPKPVCAVYSYPSGNLPAGRDGETAGKPAAPAASTTPPPADRLGRPGDRTPQPAHAPLEPLFLRPASFVKRLVDVVGAGTGLLIVLPFLPFVAAAIKWTSPGPVFFKQRRSGLGGRPFVIWKLRTMVADAEGRKAALLARNEQDGPAFKIKHDPRVTRLGRFLRKTSIDELPQLWNVLKGDMSLVGPRPLPCAEADRCEPWQRRRLDVVPGLTCIWQVRGRSLVSFADWVRMDVEYIETQSLAADVRLLLATVPAVVLRKGAC